MATWGIGDKHDSDKVYSLKEQLRIKDAQVSTLHSQITKKEDQIKSINSSFNDVVEKLRRETDRGLELEAALSKRNEELQNERVTRQNIESSFITAQQKIKAAEQTERELFSSLDTLSLQARSSSDGKEKLERENATLHKRVRELQMELAAKESTEQTLLRQSQSSTSSLNVRGRRRSSSMSTFRVTTLEREALELRTQLSEQTSELREVKERLSNAQDTMVQLENEKIAAEKRFKKELQELQAKVDDQEDDLRALRETGGADVRMREDNLLERLDYEEKRAAALHSELAHAAGSHKTQLALLQGELEITLQSLEEVQRKADNAEARSLELVTDKEEALNERDAARTVSRELQEQIRVAQVRIRELEARQSAMSTATQSSSSCPDSESTAPTQRLLSAIERLRGERDQLRQHLEFLQAENRFTVEDLKEKLAVAIVSSPETQQKQWQEEAAALQARQQLLERHLGHATRAAMVFALVTQHINEERDRDREYAHCLLLALSEARNESEQTHGALDANNTHLYELRGTLQDNGGRLCDMRANLDTAVQDRQAHAEEITTLTDSVQRLQEEVRRERSSHEEIGANLVEMEEQLADLTRALADAEEQRDSLALQLRHTEQDLQAARSELTEADARYGQQLCAMSSGEPTRALKDQIITLEHRVERRTEQIGVHQHDIKRLETNLRLQEDRIAEITSELEVLLGEKEAMVEDCKATREERNEALQRCELLEEKIERLEEERDTLSQSVSSVAERETALADELRALSAQLAEEQAQRVVASSKLGEVEAEKARILGEVAHLREGHSIAAHTLDEKNHQLLSLSEGMNIARSDASQAIIALAIMHRSLREAKSASREAEEGRLLVHGQVDPLRQELEAKLAEIAGLRQELNVLQNQYVESTSDHAARFADREAELAQKAHSLLMADEKLEKLTQLNDELRNRLEDGMRRSQDEAELREELAKAEVQHAEELEQLQTRLERATTDLREAQHRHEELLVSHQSAEDALISAKRTFEDQLAEVTERLGASTCSKEELARLESRHTSELENLREELDHTCAALATSNQSYDDLKTTHDQLVSELSSLRGQVTEKLAHCQRIEIQLSQLQTDHDIELKDLQSRLDEVRAELLETQTTHSALDARYSHLVQESGDIRQDLENQLASTIEELEYLKATLQGEMELHTRDQKKYEVDIQIANDKRVNAETALEKLSEELSALRTQLEDANASAQAMQDEKTNLQFEVTELEAEIQRSKSLQRFLESQAKDSETQIATLKKELEEAHTNYIRAEKACQAADTTSAMREIQHEQALAALRRDIQALRANPKLEDKIIELEERNTEMEELLRSKCAEIEENDDRFIEMIKEKKKLTSKIESLTRKVNSLQAKLVPLNESSAPPTVIESANTGDSHRMPAAGYVPPLPTSAARVKPPLPPIPVHTSTLQQSHPRVASAPSMPPRPKTPEMKAQRTVFKVRTPEAKRVSSQSAQASGTVAGPSSSSASIGKKRRAPDDFEDCESVPPQGFTADSVPSTGNVTPRARRAFQAVRSGFTPVRSQAAQPAHLSPSRRATAGAPFMPAVIADVTNNPRAVPPSDTAKTGKRGWLGKIRNGPTQAPTSRSVSSRPDVFERVPR